MKSRDGGLREWGSPGQTSSVDFGTDEVQSQSIIQVTFRSSSTNKLLVLRSGWNNGKLGLMIWFSLSASKGTKSKIARPSRQVSIPQFVAWNANLNSALHSACKQWVISTPMPDTHPTPPELVQHSLASLIPTRPEQPTIL